MSRSIISTVWYNDRGYLICHSFFCHSAKRIKQPDKAGVEIVAKSSLKMGLRAQAIRSSTSFTLHKGVLPDEKNLAYVASNVNQDSYCCSAPRVEINCGVFVPIGVAGNRGY